MSDKDTITQEFTDEEKVLLSDLEKTHGRVYPLRVKGHGLIVLRKPLRKEWKKYQKDLNDPRTDDLDIIENFCRFMTCYPGPEVYNKVLEEYPGMDNIFKMIVDNLATGDNTEVSALGKDWKEPAAT